MKRTYHIKLTKKAATDLEKIIFYYENQQLGLGVRFADCIKINMEFLKDFPNSFRAGLKINTREMVLNDFPFIIVYSVVGVVVNIVTVYHQRQKTPANS